MAPLLDSGDLPPASRAVMVSQLPEQSWTVAWAQPGFRGRLGLGLGLLLSLLPVVPRFYHFIQSRPGPQLTDPLLALLPVHDVSAATFGVIYGGIAAVLVFLLPRPQLLLRALWAYLFLQLLRMLTLWLLPLDPPAALLVLHDPVVDRLFEVTSQPIVRDLFFSGHTATMTLLALAVRGRSWRMALAVLTVAVGTLVLVQRVHYSYDVLAAPLFAWLAYQMAGWVCVGTASKQKQPRQSDGAV
ncbi:phosphatase PAP2-related protein [Hymenobacter sp. IS2118]|uniref:phosphatase PAP2-related protein n=1 Tax=Hymenobacter sp. IS2118 TaxID=1505605 RepID=UPI000691C5CF|nr:phosphatase PAP2-related protein [Hymenobacter sp. IS2118]